MSLNIPVKIGKRTAYIRSDPKNYILCYNTTSVNGKTGETEVKAEHIGFHGNLESLMNALIGFKVRSSTVRTLEELKVTINRSREEVMGYYETVTQTEKGDDKNEC